MGPGEWITLALAAAAAIAAFWKLAGDQRSHEKECLQYRKKVDERYEQQMTLLNERHADVVRRIDEARADLKERLSDRDDNFCERLEKIEASVDRLVIRNAAGMA